MTDINHPTVDVESDEDVDAFEQAVYEAVAEGENSGLTRTEMARVLYSIQCDINQHGCIERNL